MPEAFLRGLSTAQIAGRAQIVCDMYSESSKSLNSSKNSCGDLIFYLDGAHSPESMEFCAKWFSSAVGGIKKSSPSSIKVDNNEEILGNGHIQHKSERMEESDKLLKQVQIHGKHLDIVSGFICSGVSGQLMAIQFACLLMDAFFCFCVGL